VLPLVDVILVDLVGDDPEILAGRPLDQRLDPGARDEIAGGVARRIEVEGGGAAREPLADEIDGGFGGIRGAEEGDVDRYAMERLDDAGDQRPVRGEQEHLVARREDRPGHRSQGPRRAGRHQDVVALGGNPGALPHPLDDGVEQRRHSLGSGVAMHAGVLGHPQILHAAAFGGLHPGVPHVQRVDLPSIGGEAVGQRGVDRARDVLDGGREAGMTRHARAPVERGDGNPTRCGRVKMSISPFNFVGDRKQALL
jgi:hypothetical protein